MCFGCMSCIGNSGPVWPEMHEIAGDIELTSVLSGNRNFDGRISPDVSQNFLCAPASVVAYAMAGTMNFDFETQPLGTDGDGNDVFLRDIWPSDAEIAALMDEFVTAELFDAGAEGFMAARRHGRNSRLPKVTFLRGMKAPRMCAALRISTAWARLSRASRPFLARACLRIWATSLRPTIFRLLAVSLPIRPPRSIWPSAGRPGYVQHLRFASRQP